jgi:hypothetical protein
MRVATCVLAITLSIPSGHRELAAADKSEEPKELA